MAQLAINIAVLVMLVYLIGFFPQYTVQEGSPGYTFEWRGFVYKIVLKQDGARSWEDAEEICTQQQNGHLASILSDGESEWLNGALQKASGNVQSSGLWIGATDKGRLGDYKWIDGKPFKYAQAALDKRGTKLVVEEYEKCLSLTPELDGVKLTKEECFLSRGYICKTEGIPARIANQRFSYDFNFTSFLYKFFVVQDEWLTWREAEVYCREVEYGHLLSIGGSQQAKAISNVVQLLRWMTGFTRMWIGATGLGESNYTWTDRRPFTYTRWAEGEPVAREGRKSCVAMMTNPQWGMWADYPCIMNLPFVCRVLACSERVDLVFAIDSSGSLTLEDWELEKRAVKRLTTVFRIGRDASRVAVIRISTKPKILIDLKSTNTMAELRERIDGIPYKEGGTKTHKALKLARTKLFDRQGRPGVLKLLMLITDGVSEYQQGVAQEARRMRRAGVHMMAIGIGKLINKAELLSVASSPEDSLVVDTFEELYARVDQIKIRLCEGHARVDEQDITFSTPEL